MKYLNQYPWEKFLPTYDESKELRNKQLWLESFKISILSSDYNGLITCLDNLNVFSNLLTTKERIDISTVLYLFISENKLELSLLTKASDAFRTLASQKKDFENLELVLPWEPIVDQFINILVNTTFNIIEFKVKARLTRLASTVQVAARYFEKNQAFKILEKILPHFYDTSKERMVNILQVLALFLSGQHDTGDKSWLKVVFNLWAKYDDYTFDNVFLYLIGNVSMNSGYYAPFNLEQINFVYQQGLKTLKIEPALNDSFFERKDTHNSISDSLTSLKELDTSFTFLKLLPSEHLGQFISSVLDQFPDNSDMNESILETTKSLLAFVENSYHPSSDGNNKGELSLFLSRVCTYLIHRIRKESMNSAESKVRTDLCTRTRRTYISALLPLCTNAMFSKNAELCSVGIASFRLLGEIEPDIVLPPLLDLVYVSFETDSLSHRVYSSIRALGHVVPVLANWELYPQGAKHIIPLLNKLVSCINISDIERTTFILKFVYNLAVEGVVFMELPTSDDFVEYKEQTSISVDTRSVPDIPAEAYLTRLSSLEVESWVESFFSSVFTLLSSIAADSSLPTSSVNSQIKLSNLIGMTCSALLQQMGSRHHHVAASQTIKFFNSQFSTKGDYHIAKILALIVTSIPEITLEPILKTSLQKIRDELEDGHITGNEWKLKSINLRKVIINHIRLLLNILEFVNPEFLVPHGVQIADTINAILLSIPARDITDLASKALTAFLINLSFSKPLMHRSQPEEIWNSKEFQENHYLYWGMRVLPDDIKDVKFFNPSDQAMNIIRYVKDNVFSPALSKLASITFDSSVPHDAQRKLKSEDVDDIVNLVTIIDGSINGLCLFVKEPKVNLDKLGDETNILHTIDSSYRFVTGNENSNAFQAVSEEFYSYRDDSFACISKVMSWSMQNVDESAEITTSLIKYTKNYICNRGVNLDGNQINAIWSVSWADSKYFLPNTRLPLTLLRKRIFLQQLFGILNNNKSMVPTENDIFLIGLLSKICLTNSDKINHECLLALSQLSRLNREYTNIFIASLVDKMLAGNEELTEEKFTGGLQVLTSRHVVPSIIKNWNFIPDYLKLIIKAFNYDGHEIKKVLRNIHFVTEMHAPEKLPKVSSSLLTAIEQIPSNMSFRNHHDFINKEFDRFYMMYYQLIDSLSEISINNGNKLKLRELSYEILVLFVVKNIDISEKLMASAIEGIKSPLISIRTLSSILLSLLLTIVRFYMIEHEKSSKYSTIQGQEYMFNSTEDEQIVELSKYQITEISLSSKTKKSQFYDHLSSHSLFLPKTITASKVLEEGYVFDTKDTKYASVISALKKALSDQEFWAQSVKFSLNQQRAVEVFITYTSRTYSMFFSILGPAALEFARPTLVSLSQDTNNSTKQKMLSEIISGWLCILPDWSLADIDEAWSWIIPILEKCFANIKIDEVDMWTSAIAVGIAYKDPSRYIPLIQMLLVDGCLEADKESRVFINDLAHIKLANTLLVCFSWRITPMCETFINTLFSAEIASQKMLRDSASECVAAYFEAKCFSGHRSFGEFTRALTSDEKKASSREMMESNGVTNLPSLPRDLIPTMNKIKDLLKLKSSADPNHIFAKAEIETFSTSQLCYELKFALRILLNFQDYKLDDYKTELALSCFEMLFAYYNQVLDDEISVLSFYVIENTIFVLYRDGFLHRIVSSLINMLDAKVTSSRIKSLALNALSCFAIVNQYLLGSNNQRVVIDSIIGGLDVFQDNISESAKYSLTAIVSTISEDILVEYVESFSKRLRVPLPRVRNQNKETRVAYDKIVIERRADVMGLSCFILAFPYSIPKWMPDALVALVECVHSPSPVSTVAVDTFKEFKRTRMDTWHFDREKFTEDQLKVLSEVLVSSSYYI